MTLYYIYWDSPSLSATYLTLFNYLFALWGKRSASSHQEEVRTEDSCLCDVPISPETKPTLVPQNPPLSCFRTCDEKYFLRLRFDGGAAEHCVEVQCRWRWCESHFATWLKGWTKWYFLLYHVRDIRLQRRVNRHFLFRMNGMVIQILCDIIW